MTDCCLALAGAIFETYSDSSHPPHLSWCFFHVLRAARKKALQLAGKQIAEELVLAFIKIAYAVSPQAAFNQLALDWSDSQPQFVHYVRSFWMKHVARWARSHSHPNNQGIHTNNYVEVWHRLLKVIYLPRHTRLRPDELIHILMKEVEPDFQIASSKVLLGFRGPRTNKAQILSKRTASHYHLDDLSILGVRIFRFPTFFLIDSLSNPARRTYLVKFKPARGLLKAEVSNCNCEGFSKEKVACKHMYLLSKNFNMAIVEDPSSIFTVQWLNGPYGNVSTLDCYTSYIKSQCPNRSDLIPSPWPIGLNVHFDNHIPSDMPSTLASTSTGMAFSSALAVSSFPQPSNTLVEAQITSAPPGGSPYMWFGSLIEASVMCSIDAEDQAVTSCGCPAFQFTHKPCSHMFGVSTDLGLPILLNLNPSVSTAEATVPTITCKIHGGRKLVTECNCSIFQNDGKTCSHMRNMCRSLGLELYVMTPESDVGSDASSCIDSGQVINTSEHDLTSSQIIEPAPVVSEIVSHSDFTAPLVKSTRATLNRIHSSLSRNAINRLTTLVDPETVEGIHQSAKRLERSITDALDSGRPSKQHRHALGSR